MSKIFILGLVLLLFSSFVNAAITSDISAYWNMDNDYTTGTVMEDFYGNHDGTILGATTGVAGYINEAYDYESASSDYVRVLDSDDFSFTDGAGNDLPFSICGVFNWESTTGVQELITKYLSTGGTEYLSYLYNNEIAFVIHTDTTNKISYKTSFIPNTGQNYRICYIYNGSETDTGMKLYIDGISKVVTGIEAGSYTGMSNTVEPLIIGAVKNPTIVNTFDGIIDDIVIYKDKELTEEEVILWNGTDRSFLSEFIKFELTALNDYNTTSINEFNATFINSTNITSIQTTNGTILYNINEIANITVGGGSYFNKTFINYNTSNNLEANLTQTNITFNFIFNNTLTPINTPINVTDLTTGIEFTSINGTLTIPPNSNENLNFNFSCFLDIFIPRNITFNFNAREIANYTIELEPTLVNLTFRDNETGNRIENATINIKYPSGDDINVITNSDGSALFSYVNVDTVEFGDYEITFEGTQGFVSPITFNITINDSNVPYSQIFDIFRANININIFDRQTFTLLNSFVEIDILGLLNTNTSTGQLNVANVSIISGEYTVQAVSDGYLTEEVTFTYTNQENLTVNIYMLNATGTNVGTVFVSTLDEFFRVLQVVDVKLFEYNPSTLSYIKVSECLSNTNGECVFGIELNSKRYIITADKVIAGLNYEATTNIEGTIFFIDEDVVSLNLLVTEAFQATILDNLVYTIDETFIGNVSDIDVEFYTLDGTVTEICVEYFYRNGTGLVNITKFCEESSAAMMLINAQLTLINRNLTYVAQVYQTSGVGKQILQEFEYKSLNSWEQQLEINSFSKPFILFVWVLILGFAFSTQNMTIFVILGLIWTWGQRIILSNTFNNPIAVLMSIILLFMLFQTRKKQEIQ